jgi:hypothetical protein
MKKYKIYLDLFCEEVFDEMERIQDGCHGNVVEFNGEDKECCAIAISEKLVPFIIKQLEQINEEKD